MEHYEIAVAGLGAMGSAALYHAAKTGLQAVGLEQFASAPHTRGSHHGSTRMIRQAYFEDPAYVPLVLRAYELWRELQVTSGTRLLVETGGVFIGGPDSEVVRGALLSARTHNLPHQLLEPSDLKRRLPHLTVADDEVGVYEPLAGYLLAEQAVRAHLEQASALGARVQTDTALLDWQPVGDGVEIRTSRGTFRVDQLILTVGAWAPSLVQRLTLQVERQVVYWFQSPDTTFAQLPVFYVDDAEHGFYGFPSSDKGVKVAFHHGGAACTAETVDRTVHPQDVVQMRAFLQRRLPALAKSALQDAAVCLYTNTADQHFVVGPHPDAPQVVLGLGFSGHGFKFAAAIGELLVQLARDPQHTPVPAIFKPLR